MHIYWHKGLDSNVKIKIHFSKEYDLAVNIIYIYMCACVCVCVLIIGFIAVNAINQDHINLTKFLNSKRKISQSISLINPKTFIIAASAIAFDRQDCIIKNT